MVEPNELQRTLIGSAFVLFGIFKVAVAVVAFVMPMSVRVRVNDTPVLNVLISDDTTFAGMAFDWTLLVYALYSILHGLCIMGIRTPGLSDVIENYRFKMALYGCIGLFLLVVYSLVLFTNAPIPKHDDKHDVRTYQIAGLGSALIFLAAVPLVPLFKKYM